MIADALALGGAAELVARRLSHDDTEQTGPPVWLIIALVVLFLTCLIGCCTCCAVRCFAPENTRGPLWEASVPQGDGRWVRPLGVESWRHGWVAGPKDGSGDVIAPRLNAPGEQGPVALGRNRQERADGKRLWTPGGLPLKREGGEGGVQIVPPEL
jgi:hypothetical protein